MIGVPTHGPGGAAGLRSGDAIVALGGQPVEDWSRFATRYARRAPPFELEVEAPARRPARDACASRSELPAPATSRAGRRAGQRARLDRRARLAGRHAGLRRGDLILSRRRRAGRAPSCRSRRSCAPAAAASSSWSLLRGDAAREHRRSSRRSAPIATGLGIEEPRYRDRRHGRRDDVGSGAGIESVRNPFVAPCRARSHDGRRHAMFLRGLGKIADRRGVAQAAGRPDRHRARSRATRSARLGGSSLAHGPDQHQPRRPEPAPDPDPRRRTGRALPRGGREAPAARARTRHRAADRAHRADAADGHGVLERHLAPLVERRRVPERHRL